MRTPVIVGNWKLHTLRGEAEALAGAVAAVATELGEDVLAGVAPPFPWLAAVRGVAGKRLRVYAQNCAAEERGAHTGEVSADMLGEAGAHGVILGHSERRHVYGESDELIACKVQRALEAGQEVILCVGETLDERKAENTLAVVERQLASGLADVPASAGVVIAYEPVWAIGTGETASPEQAQEVHAAIRSWLSAHWDTSAAGRTAIQYGGSAKPSNAAGLLAQQDVDGLLVGGASLKAEDFSSLLRIAAGKA